MNVVVPEDVRGIALDRHAAFVSDLLWGKKTVGLRVELAGLPVAVMEELVRSAWLSKAPKRLAEMQRREGGGDL